MAQENDQPEDDQVQPVEQDRLGADEAARHRARQSDSSLTHCEHDDAKAEASAVADSARLLNRWERSDPLTRKYLLDGVGREMMTAHEAPPPELQAKEMPPEQLGKYVDDDFRIEINQELLKLDDPKDGLDTYLHEFWHAEQAYEVQRSHGPMFNDVDLQRASALEANQGERYINPEDGFDDYVHQITEADARAFAERTSNDVLAEREALRGTERPEQTEPTTPDEVAAWRIAADEQPKT